MDTSKAVINQVLTSVQPVLSSADDDDESRLPSSFVAGKSGKGSKEAESRLPKERPTRASVVPLSLSGVDTGKDAVFSLFPALFPYFHAISSTNFCASLAHAKY